MEGRVKGWKIDILRRCGGERRDMKIENLEAGVEVVDPMWWLL